MPLAYTSYADVSSRWVGGEVPASEATVEALLADAEDSILHEFSDLDDRITDGRTSAYRVSKVAARMVMRHLRNPGGVRTLQHGEGPFNESLTFPGETSEGLYLTDDDRAELGGHKVGGAFTIDTTPPTYVPPEPDPWVVVT